MSNELGKSLQSRRDSEKMWICASEDTYFEEELVAAQIDLNDDEQGQFALTLRMWVIGVVFSIIGCGLNTIFELRSPSISIAKSTAQLLAFPVARLWDRWVPNYEVKVRGWKFSLNPHPFNKKEHTLIFVMANISFYTRMTVDLLIEQKKFFGKETGWGFEIMMILALFLIGFSFSGITRSILIKPKNIVWPGLLSTTALTGVLHRHGGLEKSSSGSWKISGFAFFCIVFTTSFFWYWLPDFLFPALSYFSFPCWINPANRVVNQIFGVSSGMGLLPLTLDWSQVAYVTSPLLVPPWAIANVAVALVFWVYVVATACYYMNVWNTGYLPFQSSEIFDNTGNVYNVSRILGEDSSFQLDVAKYENYSLVYMPITYALNTFALAIATLASLIVWVALEHSDVLWRAMRKPWDTFSGLISPKQSEQSHEPNADVPVWWYGISLALGLFFAIFAIEFWNLDLRWYGVLFAFLIGAVFFYPVTLIYATANLKVGVEIFCRIIGGFLWNGKPLANNWFVGLGYTTILNGLSFSQDMKLCSYYHISPGSVFLTQCVGIAIGTIGQVAVINWALGHIRGICTTDAINGFSCPFSRTDFNTSIIWGAIGPQRFFSATSGYRSLFCLLILGGVLPVLVFLLRRRYPDSLWKFVNVPLFLGGLNYIPPATGMNYGSWAIVGLVFGFYIRRNFNSWWRSYNYVLGSALDSSVSLAGLIIFFTVYYTGAADKFSWWGTEVHKNTCDYQGCPRLSLSPNETI
ncbi:OPT oligopeptide transporter protein-domain-containing protein [Aspergillus pseudocaelatus]|uniref:OPT oligopeptide transporter protein-domain-containing protein n=1 Tax=Aspergillus pseudocaelatus TaxID=1825620 RepID=A0ABQ6X2X0_9EURO|nr:OPT oligopeptide transporter protein-domain-containing protein [Aspergillus pseudocaelatus]